MENASWPLSDLQIDDRPSGQFFFQVRLSGRYGAYWPLRNFEINDRTSGRYAPYWPLNCMAGFLKQVADHDPLHMFTGFWFPN